MFQFQASRLCWIWEQVPITRIWKGWAHSIIVWPTHLKWSSVNCCFMTARPWARLTSKVRPTYCVKSVHSTFDFHAGGYRNEITYCGSLEKKKLQTGNKSLIRNFAKKFHIVFDLFLCICKFTSCFVIICKGGWI